MTELVTGMVSTIIPVYNRASMLVRAVDSVLAQSWRPIEIIIADDGSTDDTCAVGQRLAEMHPETITYFWNPNRGAGPSRESARLRARGEFIQYLDSDDTLWPQKFELQVAALRSNPHCGVAYGQIRLCPEDGTPATTPHKWSGRKMEKLFPALLVDRWWNTDAPLWRRTVCDAIGAWGDLRYSQDWEYDARAGALGIQLVYCPEFVCDQYHHSSNRQTGSGRWLEPRDRVRFFATLRDCALCAGVERDSPEFSHFARWVFLNARQCAELGDGEAAAKLCDIACDAGTGISSDVRAFKALARVVGWQRAAGALEWLRTKFAPGVGPHTLKQSWMK